MKIQKRTNEYILPMLITYISTTIIYVISCFMVSTNSTITYDIEMWVWGSEFITFFFPIIAVLPFSFILFGKIKNNFVDYASVRKSKKHFIRTEILKSMIASGTTIFSIFFTTLIIVVLFIEPSMVWDSSDLSNYPFGEFQISAPIVFGFFWSLWLGGVASLFILFSSVLTLYINNFFVITLAPFIYFVAENLATALLGKPSISLTTSVCLDRLSASVMKPYTYLIGVTIFIIAIACIALIIKMSKAKKYE